MMITARFSYPDTLSQSIVEFPQLVRGLQRNGNRPNRVQVFGDIEHNDKTKVIAWIHQMYAALGTVDKRITVSKSLQEELGDGPWQETGI